MFGLPIDYYIESLVCSAADLEQRDTWDIDGMIDFADSLDDESLFFSVSTKERALDICLMAYSDQMIDWTNRGDGFKRDLFLKILEFSNCFPAEDQYRKDRQEIRQRIADGEVHVRVQSGGIGIDSLYYAQAEFNFEPIKYIGYPTESGNGLLISGTAIGISSKCEAQGTAWQFINSLLQSEYQDSNMVETPLLKSALEKRFDREQEGQIPYGTWINDVYYEVPPATDEEIAFVRNAIESASTRWVSDEQVSSIIMEEAGSYFSGDKTADEVADIVENRVNIYISEQR